MPSKRLERLWRGYRWDPAATITDCEKLFGKESDGLALLEIMLAAIDALIHAGEDVARWTAKRAEVAERIAGMKTAKVKSTFVKEMRKFDSDGFGGAGERYAIDIVKRLPTSEQKLLRAVLTGSDAEAAKAVRQIAKAANPSQRLLDAIAGCIEERLRSVYLSSSKQVYKQGAAIVAAYLAVLDKHGPSRFSEAALASSAGVANVLRDKKLGANLLARAPVYITHPRLAYKLCQLCAGRGERDAMLKYLARAHELKIENYGITTEDDPEFVKYRRDKAYLAIVNA